MEARPARLPQTVRRPWGFDREARYLAEKEQSQAFEQLLALHGCDFWHVNLPMRSKAGFPDYEIYGNGYILWAEIKARSPRTGRPGKLTAEQLAFHERIRRGGGDVQVFWLPDDLDRANDWLRTYSKRDVRLT